MRIETRSLGFRLLIALAAVLGIVWLLVLGYVLREALRDNDSSFDTDIALNARLVLASLPREILEAKSLTRFSVPGRLDKDREALYFQVWEDGGRLVHRSDNTPSAPLNPAFEEGFSWQCGSGECWRVFGMRDTEKRVMVFSAEPSRQRNRMIGETLAGAAAWSFFGYLPMFALAAWLAVRWSLKPLRQAAKGLESRADHDATPIPAAGMPSELRPFVGAINGLLARLSQAREAERAFIADAAHELRTPLAALRAQVQVAVRCTSESERLERLEKVQEGIDRTTRLAVQLLDLARADAFDLTGRRRPVDLAECARIALSDLEESAALQGVGLRGVLNSAVVEGDIDLLITLVRNLVDNALRHGSDGKHVEVECRGSEGNVLLEVRDHGPGIPEHARAAVFERFSRGEQAAATGAGLGLAIVKRIVDAHGASIELGTSHDKGGLRVTIRFPEFTAAGRH